MPLPIKSKCKMKTDSFRWSSGIRGWNCDHKSIRVSKKYFLLPRIQFKVTFSTFSRKAAEVMEKMAFARKTRKRWRKKIHFPDYDLLMRGSKCMFSHIDEKQVANLSRNRQRKHQMFPYLIFWLKLITGFAFWCTNTNTSTETAYAREAGDRRWLGVSESKSNPNASLSFLHPCLTDHMTVSRTWADSIASCAAAVTGDIIALTAKKRLNQHIMSPSRNFRELHD